MELILKKSTKPDKKLMLVSENKTVHFGSKPNKDFTIYSKEGKEIAEQKKKAYLSRHSKLNENWNKPTISGSLKDIQKRFNIKIKNQI